MRSTASKSLLTDLLNHEFCLNFLPSNHRRCYKLLCKHLTDLFSASAVTDGRPKVNGDFAVGVGACSAAHEHSETGLLEDENVMVVGVPHGPAAAVSSGVDRAGGVCSLAVIVGPLLPLVYLRHL